MEIYGNPEWKDDDELQADLKKYVLRNFKRREILDFIKRDYSQYAWRLGTLSRRLRYFNITYINYDVTVEEVEEVVREEQNGPGQLLGYRLLHKKVREQHHLAVPRGVVYDVMTNVNPEAFERRGGVGKPKTKRGPTGTFTSLGPNHTHSGDGHDKLMGFMRDTFPLAQYGMQDVFSGRILFLKLWTSNSDPKLIGRWYLEHLMRTKILSRRLRLDKGSETGHMATMHAFLRSFHEEIENPEDGVRFGPSTSNRIERWWRDLHHSFEKFFKRQLTMLLEQGFYDQNDKTDRDLLAFVFIPVIEREVNIFYNEVWNTHRIRQQKDAQTPKGVPDHMFNFPEIYGAEECGLPVTGEALAEVRELSGVMDVGEDFVEPDVRRECERIIPEIDQVKACDAADTFLFLKHHYVPPGNAQ